MRGDTICLLPLQVDNIFAFIRQVAPVPACWLFKTPATSWLWPFDLKSGVRVTCDVGYIRANFSLPKASLFSSYARCTWQTDVRQKHRLMPPPYVGGGIINYNRIYIASYGCNFRGAGGRSDQCSVKAWVNKESFKSRFKHRQNWHKMMDSPVTWETK